MAETGPAARLRADRSRLASDSTLRGTRFGAALADVIDATCREVLGEPGAGIALLALGSYARRELCPGSDVDVLLVHDRKRARDARDLAEQVWYPLWDAGLTLGHAVRNTREALALADEELDALTALLDVRVVAGDAALAADLATRARRLAHDRRARVLDALRAASAARRQRPGPVAEMLEPDLKDGAGGLRDVHALEWAGITLAGAVAPATARGLDVLTDRGFLDAGDRGRLADAARRLLDVRVELHRASGGRSDLLTLQDQDEVARRLGAPDADALVLDLARAARDVAWIALDAWDRLVSAVRGPGRRAGGDRPLADGVVLRDGRVALASGTPVDTALVLRIALMAARQDVSVERATLARLAALTTARWGTEERGLFVELLATGRAAVAVFEALDHVGVLEVLLPEWPAVRSLPQRNAYHRHTVDRHLLEAVAECAALREEEGFDGEIARRCRADLLLLGALLHDVAKGRDGDHSATGADVAAEVGTRMGLPARDVEVLGWLVRNHLLLADTATRRDLGDETTVLRVGRAVHDAERLDLLYVLTVGDSRATGPAAWSATKASLVRELYRRTDALLEEGVVDPSLLEPFDAAELARHRELLAHGDPVLAWDETEGRLRATVVATDRPGLLATVAGVLALVGFDIYDATGYVEPAGRAVEVFVGADRFGRLDDEAGRDRARELLEAALRGELAVAERIRERRRRYRRSGDVEVRVDPEASRAATVVEVHAPDEVGLLATVAAVFADLGLDVALAKVATLGDRVVDVFYVRTPDGEPLRASLARERLRATLVARLTTEYVLE